MSSFLNRGYSSEEEDSYNAAELEAHLYSQIYHDNQQNFEDEKSSSIVLYQGSSSIQIDEQGPQDVGLLSNNGPSESPGTSNPQKRQSLGKRTEPKIKIKKPRLKNVETSTPNPKFSTRLKLSKHGDEDLNFVSENESESDDVLSKKSSSDEDELGKYADSVKRKDKSKSNQRIPTHVVTITSSDDDSSSDDDVQIVSVRSGAEKRPYLGEIITLEDSNSHSDDSIVEAPKDTGTSLKKSLDTKCFKTIKRQERVTVEVDQRSKHYVAAKLCSSSDTDFSSYESDSDEAFPIGQSLSLNLSGGRFGNNPRERATRSFQQITGVDPLKHVISTNRFKSWTPEMKKFYDSVDPSMTDITLEEIVENLPEPSPPKFSKFKNGLGNNNRRYFNSPKFSPCPYCNLKDHHPRDCKQKALKRCMMCGKSGHFKLRCPERICLKCGEPGMPYTSSCAACPSKLNKVCFLCGAKGHQQTKCPDLWRRYHATTDPGQIVVPDNIKVDYTKMWCPNCGRKGHLVHQCRAYSFGACPKNVLKVVSYEEQPNHPTSKLSGSARRKKLLEVKEKHRAYKTFPHSNKLHPHSETSKNASFSQRQHQRLPDVEEAPIEARKNVREVPINPKSRSGKRQLKKLENNRTPWDRHVEQPFPRRPRASKEDCSLGVFSRLGHKPMPDFITMPSANGFSGRKSKSPNQLVSNSFHKQKNYVKKVMRKGQNNFVKQFA